MFYSYNGIVMQLARTNDLAFDAVYSDDGMDYLYTQVRIDIAATINPGATAYTKQAGVPTATPGALPTTTIEAIRHALLQPRQQLLVTDYSGQVMLRCPVDGYSVDLVDGPKPLSLTIREVQGSRSFLVNWRCECHILECPDGSTTPVLLSNRWSDQHTIGVNHLAVRSAAGKVVFHKAFLEAAGAVTDDYRHFFLPPVAPGFQRTHVDIVQNSANTEAMWRITDEEVMYDLGETDSRGYGVPGGLRGSGIIELQGRQALVSIPTGTNAPTTGMTMNNLLVTAKGNKLSNQWIMIQRLFELAASILGIGNVAGDYIVHVSVARSLGQKEKWVELQIGFYQQQTKQAFIGNINIASLRYDVGEIFTSQGGVNPNLPNDFGTRGTAIGTLVAQRLTDACQGVEGPGASQGGAPTGNPPPPEGPPPSINVFTRDELPEITPSYSPDPSPYPYTSYDLEMKYNTNTGIIQCPIAGPRAQTSQSGASSRPTSAVFRTHQPMSTLTIVGTAERIGQMPLLPRPESTDRNLVLKNFQIIPNAPTILNDAVTPVGRVTVYYEYAMLAPIDSQNPSLRVGVLPWTSIPIGTVDLTPDDFSDGIIDDPSGSSGPGG